MNKKEVQYEIKNVDDEIMEKGSVEIITENGKPETCVYDTEGNGVIGKLYSGLPSMNPHYFLKKCIEYQNGEKYEYKDAQWKIVIN